ncbi:MAG: Mth938-like domain-containing protein [Pseudomonadota bacterium]
MDVTPLIPADRKVIIGYGTDGFRISDTVYQGPVIVTPSQVFDWSVADTANLAIDDFAFLNGALLPADAVLEVLLIGTGAAMQFMAPDLRRAIRAMGPVPDIMDTGAACRTFNVLLAEGRAVAAALVPSDRQ